VCALGVRQRDDFVAVAAVAPEIRIQREDCTNQSRSQYPLPPLTFGNDAVAHAKETKETKASGIEKEQEGPDPGIMGNDDAFPSILRSKIFKSGSEGSSFSPGPLTNTRPWHRCPPD